MARPIKKKNLKKQQQKTLNMERQADRKSTSKVPNLKPGEMNDKNPYLPTVAIKQLAWDSGYVFVVAKKINNQNITSYLLRKQPYTYSCHTLTQHPLTGGRFYSR